MSTTCPYIFEKIMCDTQSDSDDSVVFVGISEEIKVQKYVHPKPESSPDITILQDTPVFKKMKLLPKNGELSCIEETQTQTQSKYQIFTIIKYIYIHTKRTNGT